MTRLSLVAVRAYQVCVSPWLAPSCRFHPTCSEYAAQAIVSFGWWRGMRLAIGRIARCHPWHPGGYDPIPECTGEAGGAATKKVS